MRQSATGASDTLSGFGMLFGGCTATGKLQQRKYYAQQLRIYID